MQSYSVSSDFASQFLILDNIPPADNEVISMMNVKVSHEEPSTQTPSLLTIPVTGIPETLTVAATIIPPPISQSTPTPLPHVSTINPAPTTEPTTTSIPALPYFSSLFRFNQRVFVLEKELSQLKKTFRSYTAEFEKKAQAEKKRDRKDKDRDEDPPTGSDQGLKKHKKSKDAEPSKGSKSKESKSSSSKGTKSQLKSSSNSAQAEESVFEHRSTKLLPPVVIREPESGKCQPLPEVPGKGKAKVTEEQVSHDLLSLQKHKKISPADQYILQRRVSEPTGSSGHDESSYALLGQSDNEEELEKARPDPGDAEAKVQSISSPVVHARSDREHMDLDVADVSPQPSTEQLDEWFTATVYPNVQENLKLAVEEPIDKHSDADKNAETEVESMVNVTIQQALSSISLMTSPIIDLTSRPESPKEHQQLKATTTDTTTTTTITTTLPPPQAPQQRTTEAMIVKRIDWAMQAPLRNHFRDLPEADMKEILHQRMWESDSYKSHEDHMQLFEALEKSMNRDHSEKLVQDLAEARKKKKKSRESPKTPPGLLSHQPPPPLPPAGPSGASGAPRASGSAQMPPSPPPPSSTNQESPSKGSAAPSPSKTAALAEYQVWTTTDIRLRPSISLTPADLEMYEDMAPDEQAQSSDDEDIGSAHIPMVNLRQGWWKPFEEERPTTPKPAWSICSSDIGDIATFIDWFFKRRGITKLKPQDLEGPAYEIVKVFHPDAIHLQYQMEECHKLLTDSVDDPILRHNVSKPLPLGGPPGQVTIQSDFFFNKDFEYLRYGSKGRRPALSISKMKAAYYPDAGLEQMVPDQFGLKRSANTILLQCMVSLTGGSKDNDSTLTGTRLKHAEDFQLGIESYQTQVNLTKPQWTATGFNDGTLLQIDEALDYRVKEFRINRLNPGLNTRFWTRKDVDRCNAFMFAIQRRLRTRRIFRNLESFVGGRVREGDYRLLRRTD
uniref:Uncharacterized protein n=1 Tax=Tanacetum cinerariifolium TaxID=118510 RepID=A0A6L2P488_TANCI|nr:hypothetical protein [Tanacetum cinerariifolium]